MSIGKIFKTRFQNTRKTSLPNSKKLRTIKRAKMLVNFYKFVSYYSSGLFEFSSEPVPLRPNISSQVKFREKSAGKSPRPITKPPFEFPNKELPSPPMPPKAPVRL